MFTALKDLTGAPIYNMVILLCFGYFAVKFLPTLARQAQQGVGRSIWTLISVAVVFVFLFIPDMADSVVEAAASIAEKLIDTISTAVSSGT